MLSTVDAAKLRPWRDATANVWAEGKPSERQGHAMAAGPDGSLYVFGGSGSNNELYKLDMDTKEWHLITPRGSVRPSARYQHAMAAVGSDIFVFGGITDQGEEARCACWPPSGDMSDIAAAIAPRAAAVRARLHGLGAGVPCLVSPGPGDDTRGGTAVFTVAPCVAAGTP